MENINCNATLRETVSNDEALLLTWANDPVVRSGSFNTNVIKKNEHSQWFKEKQNDPYVIMLIFEVNNAAAGTARLQNINNQVILSYQIASAFRGKGLAKLMLKMVIEKSKKCWGNIKILAYTLPSNIASIKSLEKVNFTLENSDEKKNCYVLNKY
jgi:RimJ/RimL family protein N-acetyltransferase